MQYDIYYNVIKVAAVGQYACDVQPNNMHNTLSRNSHTIPSHTQNVWGNGVCAGIIARWPVVLQHPVKLIR